MRYNGTVDNFQGKSPLFLLCLLSLVLQLFLYSAQRSDIGALVKELTDRMDKTKSERGQLQDNIDSMELELRQVQEEIAEVTR